MSDPVVEVFVYPTLQEAEEVANFLRSCKWVATDPQQTESGYEVLAISCCHIC